MLDNLGHVTMIVANVAKAERFYREQLGFKVRYRNKEESVSCIELGGALLLLKAADRKAGTTQGEIAFSFELDTREKFDKEVNAAIDKGAEILKAPCEIGDSKMAAVFRGLNGERIEILGPKKYME